MGLQQQIPVRISLNGRKDDTGGRPVCDRAGGDRPGAAIETEFFQKGREIHSEIPV
jgi:hypothetical protein